MDSLATPELLEREVRMLRERCEEADITIGRLQRQVRDSQQTISFRLGYALLQASKSLDDLRALPGTLLDLRAEVLRRKRRQSNLTRLGVALRTGLAMALGRKGQDQAAPRRYHAVQTK
jgi:hypothetical protein